MSDMVKRLRDAYEYAENHRVHSHHVMLDAAAEIERLEEQAADTAQWLRENFPEMYR